MAQRKLQIYVTEEQYRLLKQRAGEKRSIAQTVRDLIDESMLPAAVEDDPFFRHVMEKKRGSGPRYSAEQAKRELHRRLS
jgi:hypothetical protein